MPAFVAARPAVHVAIRPSVLNQEQAMGFLFKWIFRALVIWVTVVIAQSCGNTQVFSDDVPPYTAPGGVPGGAAGVRGGA